MEYFKEYDPEVDWREAHYEWIKENKNFTPKAGRLKTLSGANMYPGYLEEMVARYRDMSLATVNKMAYVHYKDDVFWSRAEKGTATKKALLLFGLDVKKTYPAFFVTFNFSPLKFKPVEVLKDLGKFMDKSWIKSLDGIFEYYTEEGEHPHLHMYMEVDKYNTCGKILDKMKESRLAKYCAGANFIDVKKGLPHHKDYVDGDKSVAKKDNLAKDEMWRIENNLPHRIVKNIDTNI